MVELTVGQTTKAPVKSQFGWHIIRLTDKRKRELPPLAEVQEAIGKQLRENILSRAQNDLLNKAKIEYGPDLNRQAASKSRPRVGFSFC